MNFYSLTSKMYDILDATYFSNKEKSPRTAINALIPNKEIEILDLCCGTLANSVPIAQNHKDVRITGVDISEKMLRVADKKIKKNKLENIDIKCIDATNTLFPKCSFNYIIIGLALHEMSPELQKKILMETYRVLKKDGTLIVLEWEKPCRFFEKVAYAPLYAGELLSCKTFKNFYNSEKTEFFCKNAFEVLQVYHCSYSVVISMKKAEI